MKYDANMLRILEVAVLGADKNLAREARADVLGAIAHTRGSDY